MALQSSGAISLSEVQSTHGGSNPISMSEYYLGGGVDTSKTVTGDAAVSSLTVNNFNSTDSQYRSSSSPQGYFRSYYPTINPGSISVPSNAYTNPNGSLFYASGHRDNGATGSWSASFVVNTTGTYGYRLTTYNDGGMSRTFTFTISGSSSGTLLSQSISYSPSNDFSDKVRHVDSTFSAVASETLTCTASWNSYGHCNAAMHIGGYTSPWSNKTVQTTTTINSGVPSSSTIAMSDFYSTE